jgi:transcriptional regulator with XRE-family HTH domain
VGQHETVIENRRFGTYLRKVREERKLSLDAVEELSLGLPERVTKSHLSRIENGQAIPTFPRIFTLSQIYGIPVGHLAERFEICFKQAGLPRNALRAPIDEVLEEARMFRVAGRHAEAMSLFEALLHRTDEVDEATRESWIVDLRLECINCLVKLAREATAKEECERLLASPWLSPRQRVMTFQYFAICCYRMGKFTVAMMAIERAESEIGSLADSEPLAAHLAVLKGNLQFATRQFAEAAEAYRSGLKQFEGLSNRFEACRPPR